MSTLLTDLLACLRFYSRLPLPVLASETSPYAMLDFARAIRMLPLAGAIIALPGVLVLILASWIGLSPLVAAGLVLAAMAVTTGAFHEDGLADTADGFGGGSTRERKLEIMKDSRIGSYGATALGIGLLLRFSALATLIAESPRVAVLALAGGAALSRTFALLPLVLLPPARSDGAAFAASRPDASSFAIACAGAVVLGLLPLFAGPGVGTILAAQAAAFMACLAVAALSHRQIGGQTGDVAGAAQQVAEICYLVVLGIR